jgi:hypothetical protein
MRHIVFSGKRDVPFFVLLRQAAQGYRLFTAFILATAFYYYAEGIWQDWYRWVLAVNMVLIGGMLYRTFKEEKHLYDSIYDAVCHQTHINEASLSERMDRMKTVLQAYLGLRRKQRQHLAGCWSIRLADTICYVLIIISTLQMIAKRFC